MWFCFLNKMDTNGQGPDSELKKSKQAQNFKEAEHEAQPDREF
ncbi:hypothetical protein [Oceanisphaera sp. IT1-181]|nr:hypothetical protein [Oceanisphaera sp. IT1-181]